MEKTNFWKDVAKYGAIIGALLAVSFMLETRLQISASFGLYAIEWIAVVVLHYYLLHRFTRRYSMMYTAEEGFSFGQGYAYILSVSTVAGLIVGIVQYLYLHFFIGYANYTERTTAALSDFIGRNGGVPANMESMLSQMFDQIQNTPEPSFLRTLGRNFREYSVRCRFRPYHCRRVVACAQTVRYPAKRIGTYRE